MVLRQLTLWLLLVCITHMVAAQQLRDSHKPVDSKRFRELLSNDIVQADLDNLKQAVEWVSLGGAHQKKGEAVAAKKCYENHIKLLKNHLNTVMGLNSIRFQEEYWNVFLKTIRHIQRIAVVAQEDDQLWGDLLYDCLLMSKNILQESYLRLHFSALYVNDSTVVQLWKEYLDLQYRHSRTMSAIKILEADSVYVADKKGVAVRLNHPRSADIKEVEEYKKAVDTIACSLSEIEEQIGRLCFVPQQPLSALTVTWQDVRSKLDDNQAAIEFVIHFKLSDSSNILYAAVLLRHDSPQPTIIPLFKESELKSLFDAEKLDFEALYNLVWSPIEPYLDGVSELYLSAAGLLHNLPFSALKRSESYLSQRHDIINVQSTRDIVWQGWEDSDRFESGSEALFVGGVNFGSPSLGAGKGKKSARRGQGVDYLAESKVEVERASQILSQNGWHTTLLTEDDASEQQMRARLSSDNLSLIHIASHGFWLKDNTKGISDNKLRESKISDRPIFSYSNNPLMRNGLLLAGANQVWSGQKLVDYQTDGILTGQEISSFNLISTRLVVLSACYTGVGEIDYFEGIYGVGRAFKTAGASKLVVALWDVPDKESAEFMELFYTSLSRYNLIGKSFREAQSIMQARYSDEPYKWAGFVLIE